MKFDVLTLFPDMFNALNESMIGRAQKDELININIINIRDYSSNKHKKVDDYPYGGGKGMVMSAQPIFDAYSDIIDNSKEKPYVIFMSPKGNVFNQKTAMELTKRKHLVILCGHYEGIDQRVIDNLVDEEISIGDYVLTGGELPAMVLIDSVSRLVDGVLSDANCYEEESHFNGLLEYPQYTRPEDFRGLKVPEILLSGHHKNIEKWKNDKSVEITKKNRPDMFEKYEIEKDKN